MYVYVWFRLLAHDFNWKGISITVSVMPRVVECGKKGGGREKGNAKMSNAAGGFVNFQADVGRATAGLQVGVTYVFLFVALASLAYSIYLNYLRTPPPDEDDGMKTFYKWVLYASVGFTVLMVIAVLTARTLNSAIQKNKNIAALTGTMAEAGALRDVFS